MPGAKQLFIVAAKRTAMGDFGKAFKDKSATDLAEYACRAAISTVGADKIDSIILGNVIQSSRDAAYIARHVGLRIGLAEHVPALTLNRLCGSGFQSIVSGCQEILCGDAEIVLAGGTESMTQAPFAVRGTRFGTTLGQKVEFEDTLWAGLTDEHIKSPMGITAEKLGEKYKVSRKDADDLALASQMNWRKANDAGYFKNEIVPVEVQTKKGKTSVTVDEPPRETSAETLAKLKPVFKKDGLVTAGNASGISDGAAAVVIASEDACRKHNLKPLARIVSWNAVGCDPTIMGIGPAPAIRNALKKAKLTLDQMDLIEVNEAFAAQAVAVQRELKFPMEKYNVNGGAVAVGHPLGASGARITVHLCHELMRRKVKYAVGSACIGGGQGIAIILERVL